MSPPWPVPREAPPAPRLAEPPAGTVLALAPHADDESLGCGGTLALHARRGDAVHVAVLSDGAAGDPDGLYRGLDYARLREEEARRAGECLGVAEVHFLRFPDGGLATAEGVDAALGDLLDRLRPNLVYGPSPWEAHADHWAAAAALGRVLAARERPPAWWAYEVWAPVPATHVVDVGAVWERKRRAILCYESQLRYVDYLTRIEGLARYRTVHALDRSHVEAFRVMEAGA